jgi:mutator protein MutT
MCLTPSFPEGGAPASPATVVAVAVVEHDDRFLIGQRSADKPLAGFWEFPGGKVEAAESPAVAAVRECREEAGVEIAVDELDSIAIFDYPHGRVEIHFFHCRAAHPDTPPRGDYRWVPRHELVNYQFPPANADLVTRLTSESP